jgi:hypothetical protein
MWLQPHFLALRAQPLLLLLLLLLLFPRRLQAPLPLPRTCTCTAIVRDDMPCSQRHAIGRDDMHLFFLKEEFDKVGSSYKILELFEQFDVQFWKWKVLLVSVVVLVQNMLVPKMQNIT